MNDLTFELIQKHLEGGGVYDFASSHDSAPTREALLAFGQECRIQKGRNRQLDPAPFDV